jgi:hypothetical protein
MYEDRVRKRAALLDRVRPGWAGEIARDRLAMESCSRCILGQLWGDFGEGFFRAIEVLDAATLHSASYFGFTLRDEEQDDDDPDEVVLPRFAALADAWRAEIRGRLAAGGPEELRS